MQTACPRCRKRFRVAEGDIGKRARCPKCSTTFPVEPVVEGGEEHRQSSQGGAANASNSLTPAATLATVRRFRKHRQTEEATQALQHAIALAPAEHAYHLELADLFLAAGQYVPAVQEFKRARALEPSEPRAALGIGLAYEKMGEFRRALDVLRTVPPPLSKHPTFLAATGRCHLAERDLDAALACLSQAVEKAPQSPRAHLALGLAYASAGRNDEAEVHLRQACELGTTDAEAFFELGCILLNVRNQYDQALTCNQHALQLAPDHQDAKVNLACCLLNLGRPAEAEPLLVEAVAAEPQDAVAHHLLGAVHLVSGRPVQAMPALERAISLGSPSEKLLWDYCDAAGRLGREQEALETFQVLLGADPQRGLLWALVGWALHGLGQWDAAEKHYAKARRLGFVNLWLFVRVASLFLAGQKYRHAEQVAREGLARWPDSGDLWCRLGAALEHQGRRPDAAQCFERAVQLNPDDMEAVYSCGVVWLMLGPRHWARGEQLLLRVTERNPQDHRAQLNLVTLYLNERQLDRARDRLRRAEAAGVTEPLLYTYKQQLGMT